MKFVVILALVGYASAVPALLTTGQSSQFRSQDNIGNYAFGYNEDHSTGGTFRREQGSHGVQVGSYGLRDIDGRTRVVNYVADAGGFRANIQSNEPGVEPKDPASVLINKAAAIVAPAYATAVHAAPLVAPAAVHAPIAAPLAIHAPVSHSSYSVSTNHVSAPALGYASYAAAPLLSSYAAPVAHYAAYGPAPLAAPLAVAHSAPVAYATKGGPVVQQYVSGW